MKSLVSRNGEKTESLSDDDKDELYEMALKIVKTEKKHQLAFYKENFK